MAPKIAERIREMAGVLDEDHIARALGISTEIVRGVLSGEISDETLDDFDPARPPDVRLVERKKFVRSKLIGIVSPGGCGATTLAASLAVMSAKRTKNPVAAVDLNEFSCLGLALGLNVIGEKAAFYPNVSWWGPSANESVIQHPALENLFVVLGAATAERYLELKADVIISSLKELSGIYAVTWVDCPSYPGGWKTVVPLLDVLIFVVRPDTASLSSFWQALPLLRECEDGLALVINSENLEGCMTAAECRRALKKITNAPVLAVLPEEPYVRRASLDARCYALEEPRSPYCQAAGEILSGLLPEAGLARKKHGVLDTLTGLLRRG